MLDSSQNIAKIPNWMVWVQCICFSALYAIWALPETILIRHICLITGALICLYEIYQYRNLFLSKKAIPVWLLVGLFVWATFHLIFLSNDFAAQYLEYTTIWKRAAIGTIFALGFGIALAHNALSKKEGQALWAVFYLGLLAPTLIYLIKYFLMHFGIPRGWPVPAYWQLYYSSAPFYLPKTSYVCFCLPTLGIALGQLAHNFRKYETFSWANLVYLFTIPAVMFVFYADNIKNGIVYSALMLIIFIGVILLSNIRQNWIASLALLTLILCIATFFVSHSIRSNSSWTTFWDDAKIAVDTHTYQHWKYDGEKGYPNNLLGTAVSSTNYERIAWGSVGIELIRQNPLGYGLIERSFGRLTKINWSESKLHQSHSGWIDLTLGIGIPGFLLIMICLLILLYQLGYHSSVLGISMMNYQVMALWTLLSLLLIWCTTEVSQKVFFDDLLFLFGLSSGLVLDKKFICEV